MTVFLQNYLETPHQDSNITVDNWQWKPEGKYTLEIYACGANTNTNQSTYAAEKDSRSDSDRPNEGFIAA